MALAPARRTTPRLTAPLLFAALAACQNAPPPDEGPPCRYRGFSYNDEYRVTGEALDVLLAIDASPAMRAVQAHVMSRLVLAASQLTDPPDADADGYLDYPPVRDLHVAVVSSDLGSAGYTVPGCDPAGVGDDGLVNPIVRGAATLAHRGHASAPPEVRPADCGPESALPAFLSFASDEDDPDAFAHGLRCAAGLYAATCPVSQPLEAIRRAIIERRADDRPDNTGPNAGFLRERARLAIVVFAADDDASVRDCRHAEPGAACDDATDVFDPASGRWAGTTLYDRLHGYRAGDARDPTWSLDRYVDPARPDRGFPSVKPGHAERVFFSVVSGVPPELVPSIQWPENDWPRLLGAPGADPNDLGARDASTAFDDPAAAGGAVTARPGGPDPACPGRVVPACRRMVDPAAAPSASCDPAVQFAAPPARRLLEVARRFDEAPLCDGRPCYFNGGVASLCGDDYARAFSRVARIGRFSGYYPGLCLPFALTPATAPDGTRTAQCRVRVSLPARLASCDPRRGQRAVLDARGGAQVDAVTGGPVCEVDQVPTGAAGAPVAGLEGFYYDYGWRARNSECHLGVEFTPRAEPFEGSRLEVHCTESGQPACR